MDPVFSNKNYNLFYLNLLADNALLIYNTVSPAEAETAKLAKWHSQRLDDLVRRTEKASEAEMPALNSDALQAAQDVQKFFINTLDRKISEDFYLNLKPVNVYAFVKETEKYLGVLEDFLHNRKPVYDPINEEVFWLLPFSNLCKNIADNLDNFQNRYRTVARELAQTLNEYWSFSVELQGIISRVGAKYSRLADEQHVAVNEVLTELYEFMSTIIRLKRENRIPGSISLLYLDSRRRMVCFYMLQWANSINDTPPPCNPFAPRISNY